MASDWKEQYLAALKERDTVEKANLDLYDYCKSGITKTRAFAKTT